MCECVCLSLYIFLLMNLFLSFHFLFVLISIFRSNAAFSNDPVIFLLSSFFSFTVNPLFFSISYIDLLSAFSILPPTRSSYLRYLFFQISEALLILRILLNKLQNLQATFFIRPKALFRIYEQKPYKVTTWFF